MSSMVHAVVSGSDAGAGLRPRPPTEPPTIPGPSAGSMRLATPCTSDDDFVARFARHVTETSIFIVTRSVVRVGLERPFVFQLADGTPVFQGRGRIVDVCDSDAHGRRRGMTLRFLELGDVSRRLLAAMLMANRSAASSAALTALPTVAPRAHTERVSPPPLPTGSVRLPLPSLPAGRLASGTPLPVLSEQRTPGSPFVLPANPLGELSDDHLRSFIECTLYEEGDSRPHVPPPELAAVAPLAPPDVADDVADAIDDVAALRRPVPWPALALGAALLGLGGGYGLAAGNGAPLPMLIVMPAPAAPPAPPLAATAPPLAAAVEVRPATAPAPAAGCTAQITTSARDVEVRWNDAPLGMTPLAATPVPCGPAEVTLSHPRYQRVVLATEARPDAPATVDIVMERPLGVLTVASRPAGATFTVDGAAVSGGKARVRAYAHVDVTATLPGHRPWTQRVYVRGATAAVVADLAPLARPRPRRPAR
jgi:hypothetical protein